MTVLASIRIALRALRINKLRSALTMLGIIIGVAAVIVMIAVGSGAQAKVEDQIRSLGSNLILVFSASATFTGARSTAGSLQTISEVYRLKSLEADSHALSIGISLDVVRVANT